MTSLSFPFLACTTSIYSRGALVALNRFIKEDLDSGTRRKMVTRSLNKQHAYSSARYTLLQKRFIVSAVKSFFISVSLADTILRIQKIDYFLYRLFPADIQNRFSKIKKIGAQIWALWAQIGPCSPTPVEVDVIAGSPRAFVEQWESLDRLAVGAVRPPQRWEQWDRLDCLEQWGLIALTTAYSLLPPSTTSVSLQTGAAAAAA
jgi:hypothetical protein